MKRSGNPIIVREGIMKKVREHQASSLRPEREVVGRLILRGDYAVRYEPLRNRARGDYRFRTRHGEWDAPVADGESIALLHTHPYVGEVNAQPSEADLKGAHKEWMGVPYFIYHVPTDKLLCFELLDRHSFLDWPVEVIGARMPSWDS